MAQGGDTASGGTGGRLGSIIIVLTGVAALSATLLTAVSVWLQCKNYRKPLLQRYVVRILFMVPIFSAASWASIVSLKAAFWLDPVRDVYEAFTIYAFFQLLINFIGGERALIIMMHGRPPVSHFWPLSRCLPKVDISDPHTFLAIKRGILQYTWIKPMLAIATIIMKATGTYKGGYIELNSGYFWSGLIYNVSITVSLYALAMFWVCMLDDLRPFRPMPKFLCIKGIIFASYWQGFMLSILVWLGAIPDNVAGYTPDNLAAAIQDALICFEMPFFAIWHWHAFSWHDYADITISSARMPVKFAIRDACGSVDLIQDAKETFAGSKYEYRYFDAGDNVLAHEESRQRMRRMREGMRYERGGKGKYWIPKPGQADSKTPLLAEEPSGNGRAASPSRSSEVSQGKYGTAAREAPEEPELDEEEEAYYTNARSLEFGDWNYPVITAHHASREDRLYREPHMITAGTNRHVLQPTEANRKRRKNQIEQIQERVDKGKHRGSSSSGGGSPKLAAKIPVLGTLTKQQTTSSQGSSDSGNSQLVDLVVEDEDAAEVQRVRARKEGSPEWNKHDPKHFVRAYPDSDQEEEVREGFAPIEEHNRKPPQLHTVDTSVPMDNESGPVNPDGVSEARKWETRDYTDEELPAPAPGHEEERNVWSAPEP